MRVITDHIVAGDTAPQISIMVTDAAGAGGAHHRYEIRGYDTVTNISARGASGEDDTPEGLVILFQNGPIKENGVNGITQEVLLAVVMDRLRSFQAGPFACQDNEDALMACESAMKALQRRTVNRIARGVEGTSQA